MPEEVRGCDSGLKGTATIRKYTNAKKSISIFGDPFEREDWRDIWKSCRGFKILVTSFDTLWRGLIMWNYMDPTSNLQS